MESSLIHGLDDAWVLKSREMRNFLLLLFALPLIGGCSPKPDVSEVKNFVTSNVTECGGTVKGITLVREGVLSNKFVGYAEVKIGVKEFTPDLVVYADTESFFFKLEQDVCALNELEGSVRDLQRLFR